MSAAQGSLRPTVSASNLMFLAVVSITIVTLLLKRRSVDLGNGRLATGRSRLLLIGGVGAFVLMIISRRSDGGVSIGSESIVIGIEATLSAYAGVVLLAVFLKISYDRLEAERDEELAPGPFDGGPLV